MQELVDRYVDAKDFVINEGYESEVDWQSSICFASVDEGSFLEEAAWVILNSGMREKTVRTKFPAIKEAFFEFQSARKIVNDHKLCKSHALAVFNHEPKIDAILSMAFRIARDGFQKIHGATNHYGVKFLQTFDFLGPATSFHFAKNVGLNVSKPDRHMSRVAMACGFSSVEDLCACISQETGDPVPVVDIVIWRFATLQKNYEEWFAFRSTPAN